jgi:predicted AAA+ superfamily ATPase
MLEQEIKQVLVDQQDEIETLRAGWVEREAMPEFRKMLKSSLIKVVMGLRRSGKSTLCLQAGSAEKIAYANFDDERLTGLDTKDLNTIYEILLQIRPDAEFLFFDEIQNVPHWSLFLNRLKRKKLNIIITGSNGRLLGRELASNLTGRQLSMEIMPFSFQEFLRWKGQDKLDRKGMPTTEKKALIQRFFSEYFETGGLPEVIKGEDGGPYLRELFDKIIGRDIVERYDVRTPKILKELALFLVQQSGSLPGLGKLMETFRYKSVNTLRKHISYLQDAYLLHEVSAYSYKILERSTSPKKYYACDTGLMNALNVRPTPDFGMRLETLVYLHLRRSIGSIHYLKTKEYDVDFVAVENRQITKLIQVCYDMSAPNTRERELRSLVLAAKEWNVRDLKVITLSQEEKIQQDGLDIFVVPAWKFC